MPRLINLQRKKYLKNILLVVLFMYSAAIAATAQENTDYFGSLRQRLVADGFSAEAISQLYSRPEVFVEAEGVSRFFVHSEAKLNYDQFSTPESIAKAQR